MPIHLNMQPTRATETRLRPTLSCSSSSLHSLSEARPNLQTKQLQAAVLLEVAQVLEDGGVDAEAALPALQLAERELLPVELRQGGQMTGPGLAPFQRLSGFSPKLSNRSGLSGYGRRRVNETRSSRKLPILCCHCGSTDLMTGPNRCFLKPAERIAQSDVHMKNLQIQQEIYKILCLATKNHGQSFGVQTTVLQNLQYYEHLAEPMAELVIMLAKDFDYTQLGEEVLRCVSTLPISVPVNLTQ